MTKLKLTNTVDLANARAGLIPPEQVRTVEVEALVDTGATALVLPEDVVAALGLPELRRVRTGTADGSVRMVPFVGDLRLELLGREMTCEALVMPAGTTPLIGQIPPRGARSRGESEIAGSDRQPRLPGRNRLRLARRLVTSVRRA